MKKQLFYIFLFLVVIASSSFAGNPPIKWGKILQGDIDMKSLSKLSKNLNIGGMKSLEKMDKKVEIKK